MSTICDECGSSIRGGKKEVESHQKKFHKEIICEECGVQVKGWQAYHEHKRNCQKRHCDKSIMEKSLWTTSHEMTVIKQIFGK